MRLITDIQRDASLYCERLLEIRVNSAALEQDGENIVLRGRLAPETLHLLKIDDYQRNDMERDDIYRALREGKAFPDVQIGLRSQDFRSSGDTYYLPPEAYVIDGWQRVSSAIRLRDLIPDLPINLGAKFHFGTTYAWELERFEAWNAGQRKISPSKLLANRKELNKSIELMMALSNSANRVFALSGRVCWAQSMTRGNLITGMSLAKMALQVHRHYVSAGGWRYEQVASGLDLVMTRLPVGAFRQNVITFFDFVDECWGIRNIEYRLASPQVKEVFLWGLAGLLSDHLDFWRDDHWLQIDPSLRRKFAQFSLRDPNIQRLSGSGGRSREILYFLLRNHINSGKRTHILRPREGAKWAAMESPSQ